MPDVNINTTGLRTYARSPKDRTITSLSGSDQTLMPDNPRREGFLIQNNGTSNVTLSWTTSSATANALGVSTLSPGMSITADRLQALGCMPTKAVICKGTAGQPLFAEEYLGYFEVA